MKAVTKFYSDGEVDIMLSVKATIEASSEAFSVKDIFDALYNANPEDEYLDFGTVRRAVSGLASSASAVAKEVADGQYVRN
jgi:hypothetical protein